MATETQPTLSPRRALIELAIVVTFALGSKYALGQVIWKHSGPILAIVAILACGNLAGLAGDQLGLWTYGETPTGVEALWGAIEGNLPVYLLWLAITWTSAAFAEETFFRGFLITRFRAALASIPMRAVLAVMLAATSFGYGHYYYQGMRGLVSAGARERSG